MFKYVLALFGLSVASIPFAQFNVLFGLANATEVFVILMLVGSVLCLSRFSLRHPGLAAGYLRVLVFSFICFAAVELAVLVFSSTMDHYAPSFAQHAVLRVTGIAALAWCAFVTLTPRQLNLIVLATIFAAVIAAVSIVLDAAGWVEFAASRRAASRIGLLAPFGVSTTGLMTTKGSIALLLATGCLGAVHLARQNRRWVLPAAGVILIIVIGALSSGSRTPVITLLTLLVTLVGARAIRRPSGVFLGLAGLGGLTLVAYLTGAAEVLWDDIFLREGRETRLQLFEAAWQTIEDHPVFGVGPHYQPFQSFVGERVFWNGAHTIWLQMPLYAGIAGWVHAAVLLAAVPVALLSQLRNRSSWLLAAVAVVLVVSTLYQPLQSAFVIWSLLFGVMILLAREDLRLSEARGRPARLHG